MAYVYTHKRSHAAPSLRRRLFEALRGFLGFTVVADGMALHTCWTRRQARAWMACYDRSWTVQLCESAGFTGLRILAQRGRC